MLTGCCLYNRRNAVKYSKSFKEYSFELNAYWFLLISAKDTKASVQPDPVVQIIMDPNLKLGQKWMQQDFKGTVQQDGSGQN